MLEVQIGIPWHPPTRLTSVGTSKWQDASTIRKSVVQAQELHKAPREAGLPKQVEAGGSKWKQVASFVSQKYL